MKTTQTSLVSARWLAAAVLAVALLLTARPAQSQTTPMPMFKPATPVAAQPAKEYMVMKPGKMLMKQNGKMMPMTMDMTMSDGTMCMTDGTCKMKDGTTRKMKEGDHCMLANGKMVIHVGGAKGGHPKADARMGKMKM